jgi:hypothetical protein
MGYLTKGKRRENEPLTITLDDQDFIFSFDNISKTKLNEKSKMILTKAKENNDLIKVKAKEIVIGKSIIEFNKLEKPLWDEALTKLINGKYIIKKENNIYEITKKGLEY